MKPKSSQIDCSTKLNRLWPTVLAALFIHLSVVCVFSQTLIHRYSFTNDASDSVGGADGFLVGDAFISNGAVVLDGNVPTFVDLPPDLMVNLTNFSVETWVTWNGGGINQHIFDFGTSTGGTGVAGYELSSITMIASYDLSPGYSPNLTTFIAPSNAFFYYYSANIVPYSLPTPLLHQIVWTYDHASSTSTVYVDGQVANIRTTQTITPADVGPTDNNWLGHGQYFLDPDFNGTIDEFRIYNGALSAAQVATDYTNGPDMTGRGTLSDIRLLAAEPSLRAGTTQQLRVAADYQNVSNLDVTIDAQTTYQSSDTNVFTVSATGLLTAVGSNTASANIVASYLGQTSTQTVQAVAYPAANLLHRYSFIGDASDSIGTANGTLQGNSVISNGVAALDGNNSWVQLPADLCAGQTNLTFEFWLNWASVNAWQRIFDFANNAGNLGSIYGYSKNGFTLVAQDGYQGSDGGGYLTLMTWNNASVGLCNVSAPPLTTGTEHQVVCTWDNVNSKVRIYVDGAQAAEGAMTQTFNDLGSLTNYWLAESQFHDVEFSGYIDDFRIYDNALSPQTIAAHYAAGPNAGVNVNYGPLLDVRISGQSNMLSGLSQQLVVFADYQNASNIVISSNITFSVSNPSVLGVTSQGVLSGLGSATATANVTAIVSGKSNTLTVQVIVPPTPTMLHRYSFASDASDSIGGANGILISNAVCSGGQVQLDGVSSWVQLPANFVTNLTDLTFEFWLTWKGGAAWQHIFDFGDNIGNYGNGYGYALNDFCLVAQDAFPATDGGNQLSLITFTTPGLQHSQLSAPPLSTNVEHHVVWAYNAASTTAELFVDGVLANYNTGLTYTFAGFHDAPNCWLGTSQFSDTPYNGSVNEFRIYNGALTAQQVAFNHNSGPNQTGTPVSLSASRTNAQITVSWPVAGSAGYSLQAANSVATNASWAAVGVATNVVGSQNQVTVPATNSARFFRLIK